MEECLTIDELIETYLGIMKQENRLFKTFARVMGADVKDDDDDFGRVVNNLKKENEAKDIVSAPIQAKGGEKFGIGFGLGHTEVQ